MNVVYGHDSTDDRLREARVTVDREGERSPPDSLFDFLLISLATALRVSNVVGSEHKPPLQWGDLDLDAGVLSLPEEVKKQITFSFDLEREDDGRWLASVPAFPGVMCYGDSKQEAVSAAFRLALRVVADKLEHGELTTAVGKGEKLRLQTV